MADNINNIEMQIKDDKPNLLEIILKGRLDIHTTSTIWQSCMDLQAKKQPDDLIINVEQIDYCDGAGIALIEALKQKQTNINKKIDVKNPPVHLKELLDIIISDKDSSTETDPDTAEVKQKHHLRHLTADIGYITVNILANIRENITAIGQISYHLAEALLKPQTVRWKDMWKAAEEVGPNALTIIALLGFLLGLITAFQSAIPLAKFGAQVYIGNLVAISLVRELGPLMTAIILAGRTASAFAAELGTMKIDEEIDALSTMGIDSVKFLTIPRIIATTLMSPILNIFLIFCGLVGCGIVMHTLGFSLEVYIQQLKTMIHFKDCFGSFLKSIVFGFMIAGIGCLYGLKTRMSPNAVGNSTTQAVVSSIIMIVLVDGLFACIFYALGV